MRNTTIILAALVSTVLATAADARDGQWYIGFEGGAMQVEDEEFSLRSSSGGTVVNRFRVEADTGFDIDAIAGYDVGIVRIEAEVAYKDAGFDELSGLSSGEDSLPGGSDFPLDGGVSVISAMANALLDVGGNHGIGFYAGGGVGWASVDVDARDGSSRLVDDNDSGFAWQLIGGLRFPIGDSIDLGVKYRYFNADGLELSSFSNTFAEADLTSHSLLASLIFNFGRDAPEAPPPPPPLALPPPPPPPPPPAMCEPGPFLVFFDWDESDIRPDAAAVLDRVAAEYQSGRCSSTVMLAGHADRSGTATYNVGLSQRRNDSTRAYLGSRGVPDGAMSSEAFGEGRPLVATADGVREQQNRRVEIMWGPGAGM
ncbi:MAG: OmpA family protein [Sphingomonadaceae bacterium]|nr:OmpA family protein [Sphingomonadaceae bacterium]